MFNQCSYNHCNSCNGKNKIQVIDTINQFISECETKCNECGFEDYWAHGSFESSQQIEKNSEDSKNENT